MKFFGFKDEETANAALLVSSDLSRVKSEVMPPPLSSPRKWSLLSSSSDDEEPPMDSHVPGITIKELQIHTPNQLTKESYPSDSDSDSSFEYEDFYDSDSEENQLLKSRKESISEKSREAISSEVVAKIVETTETVFMPMFPQKMREKQKEKEQAWQQEKERLLFSREKEKEKEKEIQNQKEKEKEKEIEKEKEPSTSGPLKFSLSRKSIATSPISPSPQSLVKFKSSMDLSSLSVPPADPGSIFLSHSLFLILFSFSQNVFTKEVLPLLHF